MVDRVLARRVEAAGQWCGAGEIGSITDSSICCGKKNRTRTSGGAHGRHKEDGAGERARGGRDSPENAKIGGGDGGTAAAIVGSLGAEMLGFVGERCGGGWGINRGARGRISWPTRLGFESWMDRSPGAYLGRRLKMVG